MRYSLSAILVAFSIAYCDTAMAQPSSPADCLPVLSKDHYSYARQNHLEADFLESIDQQSWEILKTDNSLNGTGIFSGGLFSINDDYSHFDQKRNSYLQNINYHRQHDEAVQILQIATAPRAYSAYEACLKALPVGSGLSVWASRETLDQIELHIQYINPPGIPQMSFTGSISGGLVAGAPTHKLWSGSLVWGVNQEKVFQVQTDRGVNETDITVVPENGAPPASVSFKRADATLELSYVGTIDVSVQQNVSASKPSPNNDHNRGSCPNEVGHQDGKWCTSRTSLSLSANDPYYFQNARSDCHGVGCPWSGAGPISYGDGNRTVNTYRDNWGSPVDAILYADKYEHLNSSQCIGDGPIPLIKGQAILFTSTKQCLPIADIKVVIMPIASQSVFKFGDNASPDGSVKLTSKTDGGDSVIIGYKLN